MLRSPNMRKQAELYASTHGFNIVVTPSYYIATHSKVAGFSAKRKSYGDVLDAMENCVNAGALGGKPEAIEAAGKSVGEQQAEFDKLVADVKAPVYHGGSIVAKLKLAEKTVRNTAYGRTGQITHARFDQRQFRVTLRYKGGERHSFVCDTRDEAFEAAAVQLANTRIKSVKLEPM